MNPALRVPDGELSLREWPGYHIRFLESVNRIKNLHAPRNPNGRDSGREWDRDRKIIK